MNAVRTVVFIAACHLLPSVQAEGDPARARADMMREIDQIYLLTQAETGGAALSAGVRRTMSKVPREQFVPESRRSQAYENRPLPIGHGQTISQPYIVALMSDLANVDTGERVLEIGTGSGYQAAILSELGARVFSIEIVEPLGTAARERLDALGYSDIELRIGDGYHGWPEHAPFDVILVTAAASHIPPPLVAQLKPGGRMIIPVGDRFLTQHLVVVGKDENGAVTTQQLLPVRFVPLTGDH